MIDSTVRAPMTWAPNETKWPANAWAIFFCSLSPLQ
jgi:hypothetical protein